jgi:hypothetical protein
VIANLQCVVLDCSDALELAQFYQSLLDGTINQPDPRWSVDDNWSTLHTGSAVLCFQRVEDHRPPRWPDRARPQQFHLDLGQPHVVRPPASARNHKLVCAVFWAGRR